MASELRVNTLKDAAGANSVAVSTVFNGSAKAWVNFNGNGTVAAQDSANISSITDNGTGDYTCNLTSAMSNTVYSGLASARDISGATNVVAADGNTSRTVTASAFPVWAAYSGAASKTLYDAFFVDVAINGDLA